MDLKRIEKAVREILIAVGEDPKRKDVKDTPRRVAEMYEEILEGSALDPEKELEVIFEKEHDEIVLLKNIPFYSVCEHHMLPFIGKCHIGYIPKKKVIGVSKLARVVDMYARRLQIQERLTNQIARVLMDKVGAQGVGVVIEAQHLCMMMRGVEKQNSKMITSAMHGSFRSQMATRTEFLRLIGNIG